MEENTAQTAVRRVDIISDTHGYLSDSLIAELKGADLIIHAGDITSEDDWERLKMLGPIVAVLGNNDYFREYGPEVTRLVRFSFAGLYFAVSHYREDLPLREVDVAVCGHTHRPVITQVGSCLVVNPGSPTFPRGGHGPSMARLTAAAGRVLTADSVDLARDSFW